MKSQRIETTERVNKEDKEFKKNLRLFLVKNDLTQAAVAKSLGLTRAAFSASLKRKKFKSGKIAQWIDENIKVEA